MPRPRVEDRGFSSLKLKRKRNMAYCYCFGKPWYFGPWDQESDRPTAEAEKAFFRQVQQWATNPEAAAKAVKDQARMASANGGPLLITLWADWRESLVVSDKVNGLLDVCEKLMFEGITNPSGELFTLTYHTVSEFTLPVFSTWQERVCAKRRNDGSPWYARATIKKHVSAILKCFQWGAQKGRVSFEQYAALKLLSPPTKTMARPQESRNVVTEETLKETLNHLFPSAHPLLWCLWHTGARPSELCRLKVEDLRRGGKVMSLSGVELDLKKLGVWCAVLTEHKTKDKTKDRVIFFGPAALKRLKVVLAVREAKGNGISGGVPLFPNEDGNHFTPPVLQNSVRRACIRMGHASWQVYSLRHALATRVQQKFGRDAARAVLGHGGGMTGGYAGVDLTTAAKVMAEKG